VCSQDEFEAILTANRIRQPALASFDWRVDVTISTSSVDRVLKPTILVRLSTSDGKQKTFEMSVKKFHELRYHVSNVLNEMDAVEKHPILKIK
jgi:hypothetical protein